MKMFQRALAALFIAAFLIAPAWAGMSGHEATGVGSIATQTNNNAPTGAVGEVQQAITNGSTATVTITIASPGVVTWTAHGLLPGAAVVFTTSGALPTGITASTTYYVLSVLSANTFTIAATPGGTVIATTGTQSGTQTGTASVALSTATPANYVGLNLTPGDWDCTLQTNFGLTGASTTIAKSGFGTTSATFLTAVGTFVNTPLILTTNTGVFSQVTTQTRFSLAATTLVYGIASSTFSAGSELATGNLYCRRMR